MSSELEKSDTRWNLAGMVTLAVATVLLAAAFGVGLTRPTDSVVDAAPVVAFITPEPTKIVVIGDSYTEGTPQGGLGDNNWASLAWRQLRKEGAQIAPKVVATGGSGYVTAGTVGETFADSVRSAVTADDDVVVVFGGSNDVTVPLDEEYQAIRDTLAMVRQQAPRARVVVIGPVRPIPDDDRELVAVRDAIRTEADAMGATFVDPIAEGWFVGDSGLIGPDAVHPTDNGHSYMAQRLLPVLRSVVARQPLAAGG